MRKESPTMSCPVCATPMNRHAEKLVHPISRDELAAIDPEIGGFVDEIHACPDCGHTATRRLPPPA